MNALWSFTLKSHVKRSDMYRFQEHISKCQCSFEKNRICVVQTVTKRSDTGTQRPKKSDLGHFMLRTEHSFSILWVNYLAAHRPTSEYQCFQASTQCRIRFVRTETPDRSVSGAVFHHISVNEHCIHNEKNDSNTH
ncbi:hypothetical protein NL108_018651 [Boleophthalmus pectinirostris]|nr:hypothetical protein NL108_018651 [Boleophthalmus pectinirostris]